MPHPVYTLWVLLPPKGIMPSTKFTLHPSFALSYIGSITVRHSSSGVSRTAALSRGRHPYLTGQPSRWASANILVYIHIDT